MTSTVHSVTDTLRIALEEQFEQHTGRLAELTGHSRQPDHGGYDRDTLNGLVASTRQALADTAEALRRMADGTYGSCEDCGNAIPVERLEALPHARHCVPCQGRRR